MRKTGIFKLVTKRHSQERRNTVIFKKNNYYFIYSCVVTYNKVIAPNKNETIIQPLKFTANSQHTLNNISKGVAVV